MVRDSFDSVSRVFVFIIFTQIFFSRSLEKRNDFFFFFFLCAFFLLWFSLLGTFFFLFPSFSPVQTDKLSQKTRSKHQTLTLITHMRCISAIHDITFVVRWLNKAHLHWWKMGTWERFFHLLHPLMWVCFFIFMRYIEFNKIINIFSSRPRHSSSAAQTKTDTKHFLISWGFFVLFLSRRFRR